MSSADRNSLGPAGTRTATQTFSTGIRPTTRATPWVHQTGWMQVMLAGHSSWRWLRTSASKTRRAGWKADVRRRKQERRHPSTSAGRSWVLLVWAEGASGAGRS